MSAPVPLTPKRFTPVEYYALERDAAYKSDYYDGEIFAMAGGTDTHSLITANINIAVGSRLRGKPCTLYESNMRLKILATGLRTYPDASVYCEPLQFDPDDPDRTTVTNPAVLVEVLSPSTEAYDRGFKSLNYRRLESLKAYVLVSQDEPLVELYERQSQGTWLLTEARGLDAAIPLNMIGVSLPLAEVYDRVQFVPTSPPLDSARRRR